MRFGVLTGLRIEAGRLAPVQAAFPVATGAGSGARAACRRLLDDGAEALLGLGLAGALSDRLAPGAVVIAGAVRLPDGGELPCDEPWRAHLSAVLSEARWAVRTGLLAGSDAVVATPDEKRELAASGAIAVDTESHHLARAAVEAGCPFAVMRVIVDRAQDRLPPFLAGCYDGNGRLRPQALLGGLLRQPGALPAFARLAWQGRRALATLGGVGRLGAALGPP